MESLGARGWVPGHVRAYLEGRGYAVCQDAMASHIREWESWMAARGDFYDYSDVDGFGRAYRVRRRSLRPAMRVCREWGSLLLNERTVVDCGDQTCTERLARFFADTGFWAAAQECVVRAFGLGTGAWALQADTGRREASVRFYDAREIVPLAWDSSGVSECAFVTRAYWRGRALDQVQVHLRSPAGYRIETALFDAEGAPVAPDGVLGAYETGSEEPTFAVVRPAVENTRVDGSPYGQSVFADALGAVQAVDLAFDALFNEVDVAKMRVFLSDVMFETGDRGEGRVSIPFGRQDCTVFRKVMSTEDTIQQFAPTLRTEQQERALRVGLRMLGDLCGFGSSYFDFDADRARVKTATEVSSDNSALMRNVRRHENLLQGALAGISRAVLAALRGMGEGLPGEGQVRVLFDDSIVSDTASEKRQDMEEVAAGLMAGWEYRAKWYGEDEATARRRASEAAGAA